MSNELDVDQLVGADVVDAAEERIGRVHRVYLDERDGEPRWLAVRTGPFGSRESVVPVRGTQTSDGEVRLPYTRNQITGAPSVGADGRQLDGGSEAALYRYYGLARVDREQGGAGAGPTPPTRDLP